MVLFMGFTKTVDWGSAKFYTRLRADILQRAALRKSRVSFGGSNLSAKIAAPKNRPAALQFRQFGMIHQEKNHQPTGCLGAVFCFITSLREEKSQ
jgi:hypothetical protein